jgi:hypothetical protein
VTETNPPLPGIGGGGRTGTNGAPAEEEEGEEEEGEGEGEEDELPEEYECAGMATPGEETKPTLTAGELEEEEEEERRGVVGSEPGLGRGN